jgi:hypothetical protein
MMKAYADSDTVKVNWCKQYIHRLREISYKKIDDATSHVAKVIIPSFFLLKVGQYRMLIYSWKKNPF